MIKIGVDLLNFKSEYTGGLNSFSLGLLKSLEKKCNFYLSVISKLNSHDIYRVQLLKNN